MKKATSKTERYITPILGIKVSSTELVEVLNELLEAASEENFKAKRLVVTPNPEIIMAAQKSQELTRVLNNAYLAVPDGVGLKLAGIKEIIPGRVLAEELIGEAARRGMRVFLLGGREGVAESAVTVLNAKWPMLNAKCDSGPWLDEKGQTMDGEQKEEEVIGKINKFRPHFLFVGFGPPKQEFWLDRNLSRLRVGIAMTVGGALDYWAGEVPIPPKIASQAGLEWLWRLITQPWRASRIFTAVVRFPLAVLWYKLTR